MQLWFLWYKRRRACSCRWKSSPTGLETCRIRISHLSKEFIDFWTGQGFFSLTNFSPVMSASLLVTGLVPFIYFSLFSGHFLNWLSPFFMQDSLSFHRSISRGKVLYFVIFNGEYQKDVKLVFQEAELLHVETRSLLKWSCLVSGQQPAQIHRSVFSAVLLDKNCSTFTWHFSCQVSSQGTGQEILVSIYLSNLQLVNV